jgi:hypothetical protein
MNELFFQKILPSQGVLCVASINKDGTIVPKFPETVDELLAHVESFLSKEVNIYFTPGSYEGSRRKQSDCVAMKCFFLDLDFMHGKNAYPSKEAAIEDVYRFCEDISWPLPTLIDSGGGIHAYWIFEEDVPSDVWDVYAKQFKDLCLDRHLIIDECVPADSARLMRVPGSINYRYNPPAPAVLLTEVFTYSFETLIEVFGSTPLEPSIDLKNIFDSAEKGIDEASQKIWDEQRKNFEFDFYDIVEKSLDGTGCKQIAEAVTEAATLPEPQWYAAMSVAVRCKDGMEAVHKLSEDYPKYNAADTERKANQSLENAGWAHSCDAFESINPAGCRGCPHKGKLGKLGPISLGKTLRIASASEAVVEVSDPKDILFPDYMLPYARGQNGGIYFTPPPRHTKDGKRIQDDAEQLLLHDLFPTQRVYSPMDGECMMMRLILPRDGQRNFLLPLKEITAQDKLKSVLAHNGVVFEPMKIARITSYLMKWSGYFINVERAETMHMQQGWTEDFKGFILGSTLYERGGERPSPQSPWARNIIKNMKREGSYDRWKKSAQDLNRPHFEKHAIVLLSGFASILMPFTAVNGITVSALGQTGSAKTGSMYGALSIWGEPKSLTLGTYTHNALIQRMIGSKNLPFGMDEQTNCPNKDASDIVYSTSAGKPKLRMQSSTNSERTQEYMSSLISIITTNQSWREKIAAYKSDSSAEEMRLLEMTFPVLPELNQKLGTEIFDAFNHHYGHAGPIFVQHLLGLGADDIKELISVEMQRVMDRFNAKSEYRFLNSYGALIYVAAALCKELDIVDYDMDRIGGVLIRELNAVSNHRDQNKVDPEALLGEFMDNHLRDHLVISDGRVTHDPYGSLLIRTEVENGRCLTYVSTSALKAFLADKQASISNFEDTMVRLGKLGNPSKIKKKMAAGWKAGLSSTNINAYVFTMDPDFINEIINEQPRAAA